MKDAQLCKAQQDPSDVSFGFSVRAVIPPVFARKTIDRAIGRIENLS
jgi:hypothetical protein